MQQLGTEFGRSFYPSIWVNHTKEKAQDLLLWAESNDQYAFRVIIDDIRFQNEADMVHELGGEVWKVNREGFKITEDKHSSEAGLEEKYIDKEMLV